jgi:hypothetical protein
LEKEMEVLKEAAAAESERLNAELASTNEVIFVNEALTSAYSSPLTRWRRSRRLQLQSLSGERRSRSKVR